MPQNDSFIITRVPYYQNPEEIIAITPTVLPRMFTQPSFQKMVLIRRQNIR